MITWLLCHPFSVKHFVTLHAAENTLYGKGANGNVLQCFWIQLRILKDVFRTLGCLLSKQCWNWRGKFSFSVRSSEMDFNHFSVGATSDFHIIYHTSFPLLSTLLTTACTDTNPVWAYGGEWFKKGWKKNKNMNELQTYFAQDMRCRGDWWRSISWWFTVGK